MIAKVTTAPAGSTGAKNSDKASDAAKSGDTTKKGLFGSILESARKAVGGGTEQADGQTSDGKDSKKKEAAGKQTGSLIGDVPKTSGEGNDASGGSLAAALPLAIGEAVEAKGDENPVQGDSDTQVDDTASGGEDEAGGKAAKGKTETGRTAVVNPEAVKISSNATAAQEVQQAEKAADAGENEGKARKQAVASEPPVKADKGQTPEKKPKMVKEPENPKTFPENEGELKDVRAGRPGSVKMKTEAQRPATVSKNKNSEQAAEEAASTDATKKTASAADATKASPSINTAPSSAMGKPSDRETTEIKGSGAGSTASKAAPDIESSPNKPVLKKEDDKLGAEGVLDQGSKEPVEKGSHTPQVGKPTRPAPRVMQKVRPMTTKSRPNTTERPVESNTGDKKAAAEIPASEPADGGSQVVERVISEQGGVPVSAVKNQLKGSKADRIREQKYGKYVSSFGKRAPGAESASRAANAVTGATVPSASRPQPDLPGFFTKKADGSEILFKGTEEIKNWKEQTGENLQFKQDKGPEGGAPSIMRMAQAPIANLSVRRTILPGLTRAALQASSGSARAAGQGWQKHSIELDNGKNINVSARKVDGVIQLKLSTLHNDLGRLLQQHQQEIRQHLERECALKVDLQFEGQEEQQDTSGFFGDSSSSRQGRQGLGRGRGDQASSKTVEQVIPRSVRNFGYNKMEWIA